MHPPWNFLYEMAGVNPQKRNQNDIVIKSFFGRVGCCHFVAPKKNVNQSVLTFLKRNAHSVLAKKIINQTVDFVGGLVLGSKKIEKPICSDFVFSKCQMLISKKITKPICSHFQCSVLISKKITEPICSDLVFKKCPFSFGQENYKPNCRLCRWFGAGF